MECEIYELMTCITDQSFKAESHTETLEPDAPAQSSIWEGQMIVYGLLWMKSLLFCFCFAFLYRESGYLQSTQKKKSTWRREKYQGRVYKIKCIRNLLAGNLSHHLLCNKALKT